MMKKALGITLITIALCMFVPVQPVKTTVAEEFIHRYQVIHIGDKNYLAHFMENETYTKISIMPMENGSQMTTEEEFYLELGILLFNPPYMSTNCTVPAGHIHLSPRWAGNTQMGIDAFAGLTAIAAAKLGWLGLPFIVLAVVIRFNYNHIYSVDKNEDGSFDYYCPYDSYNIFIATISTMFLPMPFIPTCIFGATPHKWWWVTSIGSYDIADMPIPPIDPAKLNIDVFTGRGGMGRNIDSEGFAKEENITIGAVVFYDNQPLSNQTVNVSLKDPNGQVVRGPFTGVTNENGTVFFWVKMGWLYIGRGIHTLTADTTYLGAVTATDSCQFNIGSTVYLQINDFSVRNNHCRFTMVANNTLQLFYNITFSCLVCHFGPNILPPILSYNTIASCFVPPGLFRIRFCLPLSYTPPKNEGNLLVVARTTQDHAKLGSVQYTF